jgi:hypothetical protein
VRGRTARSARRAARTPGLLRQARYKAGSRWCSLGRNAATRCHYASLGNCRAAHVPLPLPAAAAADSR